MQHTFYCTLWLSFIIIKILITQKILGSFGIWTPDLSDPNQESNPRPMSHFIKVIFNIHVSLKFKNNNLRYIIGTAGDWQMQADCNGRNNFHKKKQFYIRGLIMLFGIPQTGVLFCCNQHKRTCFKKPISGRWTSIKIWL